MEEIFFLILFQAVFGTYTESMQSPFYLSACLISLFFWNISYLSLKLSLKKRKKAASEAAFDLLWSFTYEILSLSVVVAAGFSR